MVVLNVELVLLPHLLPVHLQQLRLQLPQQTLLQLLPSLLLHAVLRHQVHHVAAENILQSLRLLLVLLAVRRLQELVESPE